MGRRAGSDLLMTALSRSGPIYENCIASRQTCLPVCADSRMSREQITWRAVRAASRMYLADRPQVALDYLAEALEADPSCYEALVMAGELVDHWAPELGLDEREGASKAIVYFDRAIAARPDDSEAYAEKAITLLHLEEHEASIEAANRGLALFGAGASPAGLWLTLFCADDFQWWGRGPVAGAVAGCFVGAVAYSLAAWRLWRAALARFPESVGRRG